MAKKKARYESLRRNGKTLFKKKETKKLDINDTVHHIVINDAVRNH